MAEQDAALSDAQISLILDLMDEGGFEYISLEMGDFKLAVSRSGQHPAGIGGPVRESAAAASRTGSHTERTSSGAGSARQTAPDEGSAAAPRSSQTGGSTHADGAVPVVAPTIGIFYRRPEPGAEPFVDVGTRFEEGSTLGLVEVMKTYIAVEAELPGVVLEILVGDEAFVEYGQPLFLVSPEPTS